MSRETDHISTMCLRNKYGNKRMRERLNIGGCCKAVRTVDVMSPIIETPNVKEPIEYIQQPVSTVIETAKVVKVIYYNADNRFTSKDKAVKMVQVLDTGEKITKMLTPAVAKEELIIAKEPMTEDDPVVKRLYYNADNKFTSKVNAVKVMEITVSGKKNVRDIAESKVPVKEVKIVKRLYYDGNNKFTSKDKAVKMVEITETGEKMVRPFMPGTEQAEKTPAISTKKVGETVKKEVRYLYYDATNHFTSKDKAVRVVEVPIKK